MEKRINKLRALLLTVFFFAVFVGGGIFVAKRSVSEDWVWAFLIFIVGFQWVYSFLLNRRMYTFFIGETMYANSDRYKLYRVFHFLIGLVLCICSSVA